MDFELVLVQIPWILHVGYKDDVDVFQLEVFLQLLLLLSSGSMEDGEGA